MWRKLSCLLSCFSFSPYLSFGQVTDSVRLFKIEEVRISARKAETFAAGSRQTKIDSTFLSLNNAGNLTDILQGRSPVYIKSYGHNMLATPAFRGTSASHTAVLWNGFNLNQPTLGLSDFSMLPVAAVNSVQLQHGSAGANFGTGAIGGAVLLSSISDIQPGLKLHAQQDFGSFGKTFSQVGGSYGFQKFGVDATVFHTEAENDFKYTNTAQFGKPEERQENAAISQSGFTANLFIQPNSRNKFIFRNWYTNGTYEAQASMASDHNQAQNINRNLRLLTEWEHRSGLGITTVRGAFFNDFMQYSSKVLAPSDVLVKTYQMQAEQGIIIRKKVNLNIGGDAQLFDAAVAEYGRPVTEKRASVFALIRYDLTSSLSINANWRQAFVQNFNPPAAPAAGFKLNILNTKKTTLGWKGSISRGYRVPTLNERFWPPGSPNLKPESSWSYETGLAYRQALKNITFETELTGYRMQVENWIQWISGPVIYPENLKTVEASGLEYSAKLQHKTGKLGISLGGNYAFTVSEQTDVYDSENNLAGKQLIYVPFHTAGAFTDATYKSWSLTLNWQLTGMRFVTPENTRSLPSYNLLNVYAAKSFKAGKQLIRLVGQVNNVTNVAYQNYRFYAMPGRHYNLSIRYQFN